MTPHHYSTQALTDLRLENLPARITAFQEKYGPLIDKACAAIEAAKLNNVTFTFRTRVGKHKNEGEILPAESLRMLYQAISADRHLPEAQLDEPKGYIIPRIKDVEEIIAGKIMEQTDPEKRTLLAEGCKAMLAIHKGFKKEYADLIQDLAAYKIYMGTEDRGHFTDAVRRRTASRSSQGRG